MDDSIFEGESPLSIFTNLVTGAVIIWLFYKVFVTLFNPEIVTRQRMVPDETNVFTGNERTVAPLFFDTAIQGDRVYIAEPPDPATIKQQGLLYFPNGSGIAPNNRVLADEFARAGYVTIIVDYLNVTRAQGEPERAKDAPKPTPPDQTQINRRVDNAIHFLRRFRNCNRIGAVGYCSGGPQVMRLLLRDPCPIDAAFIAHPARVAIPDYTNIRAPLSLAQPVTDRFVNIPQRHQTEAALIANTAKLPWQTNLFSGVGHGFASRLLGDGYMNEDEVYAKHSAHEQAVMWFESKMDEQKVLPEGG